MCNLELKFFRENVILLLSINSQRARPSQAAALGLTGCWRTVLRPLAGEVLTYRLRLLFLLLLSLLLVLLLLLLRSLLLERDLALRIRDGSHEPDRAGREED